jgi:hypothetical protein
MAKRQSKIADAKKLREMVFDGAINWIGNLIAVHERTIRDLKERRQCLIEIRDGGSGSVGETGTGIVSLAVNDVASGAMNYRLDMAANHAAALALADVNVDRAEEN